MIEVGVHEAKTQLSRLLRQVATGEEVLIKRGAEPVAKIVRVTTSGKRELGQDEGSLVVPEDFDDPLSDELLDPFYR